jgi:hypothetical protein
VRAFGPFPLFEDFSMNFRLLAALAALSSLASAASAHVTLVQPEAIPGQVWDSAIRIGHGCSKSPTTRIELTIPPMLGAPIAVAKPGWKVETLGTTIIWSGGSLPDGEKGEFAFQTKVAKDATLGSVVAPVIQKCESGEHRWVEIVQPGQDPKEVKSPAPVVKLVVQLSVQVQEPWVRATPKGAKVAGGFAAFVNPGPADRLVSASFPTVAGRTEIHEMAMSGGTMTMRALANGIEIPGNGRLDFKPGGFHLMLMDLKVPLAEGQSLEGTLVFEKAGPVAVKFPVMAIGAPGPAHQHKH